MKYIIITPAKDEEKYIDYTLKSVISQTIKPKQWIIVNDGSTDRTEAIIKKYLKNHNWIKLINNKTEHENRKGGSKVVRAFYAGYNSLAEKNYDFIVKLDADLTLPKNYFEMIIAEFKLNPKLGLCGGYCVNEVNGKLIREKSASYHIRGAFKFYKRKCFEEIGGFKLVWNWDGLDEMMAMYRGWEIKVIDKAVIHHRLNNYNIISYSYPSGITSYKMRDNLIIVFLKTLKRLLKKPFIIGGLFFFIGYLISFFKRESNIVDKDLGKFIRKMNYKKILKKI